MCIIYVVVCHEDQCPFVKVRRMGFGELGFALLNIHFHFMKEEEVSIDESMTKDLENYIKIIL